MKILTADFILTCRDDFEIIRDGAICFDKNIVDLGERQEILQKYKDAEVVDCEKNSVIMPGLINPHVHLEFSANKTSLKYGNFISWLESVIKNRDTILQNSKEKSIDTQLQNILHGGTTTLGAISSFGDDLASCIKTPQKIIYFNEILGSRPDAVDILFDNFKSRLHQSEDNRSATFIPAISVHSPYSTHPILTKNVLDIARKDNYLVSTHFMESKAERDWLNDGNGDFLEFFNSFMPNARPLNSALEYLNLFYDTNALFTHCTQASDNEIQKIKELGGFITHCPVSNRLLGSGRLEIENIDKEMLNLATDGLSSNISLNLWDEMRAALMLHFKADIEKLSKRLLLMSTKNAAKALRLNNGVLDRQKDADILVVKLADKLINDDLATQLILHTKKAEKIYINGEEIL